MRLDPTLTYATRAEWLLDLEIGGVRRFATALVVVDDRAGDQHAYDPGLGDFTLDRAAVSGLSVDIDSDDDWAELVQQGVLLTGARATLRRWWPDQLIEEAEVLFDGEVEAAEYGARGEPLSLSLVPDTESPRAESTFPPPGAKVDESTWPFQASPFELPPNDAGAYYPWVIGAPGHNGDSLIPYDAVMALAGEYNGTTATTLVIAGHRVHATNVRLRDPDDNTVMFAGVNALVSHITDNRGRTVAVISTSGTGLSHDPGKRWAVGFQDDASYGCGIEWQGRPLRGAGSVIEWAMLTWSPAMRFDRARQAAQRAHLDGYLIDTWVNDPITGLDFVESVIAPLLPVMRVDGPDGVYWQVMRYDAKAEDATSHLIGGHDCERTGRVGWSNNGIVNEVTVEYGRAGAEAKTYKIRTVTGQSGKLEADPIYVTAARVMVFANDDDRILGSALARRSQQRYGLRSERVRTSAIWDDTTAVRIAMDRIARDAERRRVVRYVLDPEHEGLRPGDVVLLSDDDLYLSAAVCLVRTVVLGAQSTATLEVLTDPTGGTGRSS